jgi:hypothetical protein
MKKLLFFGFVIFSFSYALQAADTKYIKTVLNVQSKFLTDTQVERIWMAGRHAGSFLSGNAALLKPNNRAALIRKARRYGADPDEVQSIFDLNGYSATEDYLESFYTRRLGTVQEKQALVESKKKSLCCALL